MDTTAHLHRLWEHSKWADGKLFVVVRSNGDSPFASIARAEYAHVLAVEERWLARIQQRAATTPVWPEPRVEDIEALREQVFADYDRFLSGLSTQSISAIVSYTTSAGDRFENTVEDILLHVCLHGQYHRGKINLLLRQAEAEPEPVDYIGFVRGTPAAVSPPGYSI